MTRNLIKRTPTQEELKSLFHYDPQTGVFTHRTTRGKGKAGDVSGKVNCHGYVEMRVFNKLFGAHRLAFLYMAGAIPERPYTIDHINGDKKDNRWSNLRVADYYQQSWNSPAHKHNKSGLKGAWPCKATGRWQSMLQSGPRRIWLGRFDTAEEAHRAWIKAATEIRGPEWVARATGFVA